MEQIIDSPISNMEDPEKIMQGLQNRVLDFSCLFTSSLWLCWCVGNIFLSTVSRYDHNGGILSLAKLQALRSVSIALTDLKLLGYKL